MGKAFVAKLAKEGARDPEALAAWIGRKKHGGAAFKKLAANGRKKGPSKSPTESPEVRKARAQVEAAKTRAAAARDRADRANQSASGAYGRFAGGQKILSGHHSERSALRDRDRADAKTRRAIASTEEANKAEADVRKAQAVAQGAEMRGARSRPWGKGDFQPGDTVQIDRAGKPGQSYRVVRANAKSVTVSRGYAGMDNKSIPHDKILSRTRDGETTIDPEAGTLAADARPGPTGKAAQQPADQGQAVSDAKMEAGRRQARSMTEPTLRELKSGLAGKRDPLSRAQRQVITEEIRRRREEEKANRVTAQERKAQQRARTQEIQRQWQADREAREAERQKRDEALAAEAARKQEARAAEQKKRTAVAEAVRGNIDAAERAAAAGSPGKSADTLRDEAKAATEAIAAFNDRDTVRNGKTGRIGTISPEYDHSKGGDLNERAAGAYRVAAASESDESLKGSLEFAAHQHEAAAQRHRAYAAGTLVPEGEDPGRAVMVALTEASQAVGSVTQSVRSAENLKERRAEEARERERRQAAHTETLGQINAGATGRSLRRKTLTKEERQLVNSTALRLSTDRAKFEEYSQYADESAQRNRVDVLRSRAFAKAKADRDKRAGASSGAGPAAAAAPAAPRRRDPVADARARNAERAAGSREAAAAQRQGGFTEAEERQLTATGQQTARMNMGQLQAYEQAYKPGTLSSGRTREDDLRHEAVRREIARRHDAVRQGMDRVRKLNQGAHKGSFMMGERPEGVDGRRLGRMSDEKVNRNLQLVVAIAKAAEENGVPMSRQDKSLLYDVMSALRGENMRRNLPPVR